LPPDTTIETRSRPARRPDPAGAGEDLPDTAHGFLFQYHADFARDVDAFLGE